jgi:hypothetical protein
MATVAVQLIQVSSQSPHCWNNSDPLATANLKIRHGMLTVADFSKIEG